MDLFNLSASLTLDTSEYESGVEGVQQSNTATVDTVSKLQAAAVMLANKIDELSTQFQENRQESQTVVSSMDSLKTTMDKLADSTDNSKNKQNEHNKSTATGIAKAQVFANAITSLAKKFADLATSLVKTGVEYNSQIENYQMALTNLLGDANEAATAIENIKADAAATPFDTASLVEANQYLIAAGENSEYARATINALGDAVAATGGGSEELARMAQNLQQVANQGKATSVDIKQFATAGINIYGILADYTGKTTAEVQDMTITYDVLTAALQAAAEEGGRYYGAMDTQSQTMSGRLSTLKDNWTQLLGKLTEGISSLTGDYVEKLISVVQRLNDAFDSGGIKGVAEELKQIAPVLSPLISAIEIITENFSVFATVVVAATAAVVAYKIAMNFSSIVEGVTKALTAAKTAVLDVNAAMAANPIGAVITLLAALAAALITAYNTSDTFRTKVNSAFSKVKEGAQSLVIKLKSIPLAFKNIVDIVKKLLSGESVDLSSYVWSYAETTEGMWEAYNNKVADIREKHAASVAEAASVVVTTVEDAGEDIESSIKSTADTATSTSSTTTATVLSDAEKIKNAYSGSILETISNFFSNLKSKNWSGVGSALVTIGWGQISASQRKTLTAWALKSLTTINEAYESDGLVGLIETADNLLAGVADYLTENSDTLATGIRGIFDGIVETTKSDGKSILSSLYSIGESIVKITSTSFPEASETISGVVTSIGTWGSAILSFVQANWVGLLVAAVVLLVNSLVTLWDTSDGFRDWTANIKKSISKVFSTVKEVVENFIKALPKTIKILLNAIPQALKWLVGEALPAAIKWIFGELLPMLIEALGDIIAELLEYVLSGQAFTDMLEIGVTLISSLIDGIFYAIPKIGSSLLTAIGKIVSSIGQAFKDLWSNILSIGENIVKGIFEGFTNGVKSLWQGIKDVCAGIVDGIKEFFGIHSPSTMFRDEVGQYMALGIGEGFEKAIPQTIRDMQDELDGVTASLNTTLTPALAGIGETSGTSTDISSLYALLNAYLPALANMQVVLDGGALVGELAPQMDMQLGRIAMRKERGN